MKNNTNNNRAHGSVINKLPAVTLFAATVFSTNVLAEDSKLIEHTINVANQSSISINFPVGEIELVTSSDDQVVIEVVVKEKGGSWFSSANLDNIELSQKVSDKSIKLEIDDDDIKQEWRVSIPQHLAVEVDLGVGQVEVNGVSRDVDVNVGVGAVELGLANNNYRIIDASSGVGDAHIRGVSNVDNDRAVVSKNATWHGEGKYAVEVDVGVGDADIRVK